MVVLELVWVLVLMVGVPVRVLLLRLLAVAAKALMVAGVTPAPTRVEVQVRGQSGAGRETAQVPTTAATAPSAASKVRVPPPSITHRGTAAVTATRSEVATVHRSGLRGRAEVVV